jgi:hypothetical protein
VAIAGHFSGLEDPRSDNRRHLLLDIIVIAICAADTWTDVELLGEAKEAWVKGFLELPHGIPLTQPCFDVILSSAIHFEEVTLDRVLTAAQVKAHHTICYTDTFTVALAQELDATIVTGNPEFKQVESFVQINGSSSGSSERA